MDSEENREHRPHARQTELAGVDRIRFHCHRWIGLLYHVLPGCEYLSLSLRHTPDEEATGDDFGGFPRTIHDLAASRRLPDSR